MADALYPVAAIADLLMLGGERVRQLTKSGFIAKAARNRVSLTAAVQGYIRFLREEAQKNTKSASSAALNDERRLEIAQRRAEAARRVVPREDAEEFVDAVVGDLIARLVALPAAFTRNMDDRRKLEGHIDGIRSEAAKQLEEQKQALRSSDLADPADDET